MKAINFLRRIVFLLGIGSVIGTCPILPPDHAWNTAIDCLPVHAKSSDMVKTIGEDKPVHPDFGAGQWDGADIGIPYIYVNGSQEKFPATFLYDDESDAGPYAIPLDAPIEGGSNSDGDRHVIAVDGDNCILYELYYAHPKTSPARHWDCGSGVVASLTSYELRPDGWTSADAAGLLIYPGLVKWEDIERGEINHAIRFTAPQTRSSYVWPARHEASSFTPARYPPMGQRFRLKANFDISGFSAVNQIILKAMKKYGIILADNGSSWYISGSPNSHWDDDDLHKLQQGVKGSNFEAVESKYLMMDPNSGQANQICTTCGDGVCNATAGETIESCLLDCCGAGGCCGDGVCNKTAGETIPTCFKDCCGKAGSRCNTNSKCCSKKCSTKNRCK